MTHAPPPARALAPRRLQPVSVEDCLEFLDSGSLGRVAFVRDGEPCLIPVNYVMQNGMVVFRLTYGTTLDTIGNGARVAFEVDRFDPSTRTGWSVVIQGKAEEIWQPAELEEVRRLPINPSAPGERNHYVRIFPATITGRRIG